MKLRGSIRRIVSFGVTAVLMLILLFTTVLMMGGPGSGNGDFTTGQFYEIDKSPPIVTFTLLDPPLTNLDEVRFGVEFDSPVAPTFDADDVTLRNFVINCGGNYGIKVYNGHQGIVIEDGEITGGFDSAGILGLGYTGSRLYVHDGKGDGLKTEGSTPGQTIIEDSLVECLGAGVQDPHTDAVQMAGGSSHPGITFRRNNFNMPDGGNPSCPGAAGNSALGRR